MRKIKALSGIHRSLPITQKAAVTPPEPLGLGDLQKNDVFFSGQSYRAQLTKFITDPTKTLMFSFSHPDTLWDRLLPFWPKTRSVLLLSTMPATELQF